MLAVSVILPYCNYMHSTENLRNCLASLDAQTVPPHQIIICDDSAPEDRREVLEIARAHGAAYLEFPFVNYAPAFSRKFNLAAQVVTGDAICLLCSNWVLGANWMEEMAKWLEELGPGNLVSADNARKNMKNSEGVAYDYFQDYPERFCVSSWHFVDEGFLTMLYARDWIPYDEDFDPVPGDMSETKGAWHAVIEWGFRLMKQKKVRVWIRRDLEATHQQRGERPKWYDQIEWSDALSNSKGVWMPQNYLVVPWKPAPSLGD